MQSNLCVSERVSQEKQIAEISREAIETPHENVAHMTPLDHRQYFL